MRPGNKWLIRAAWCAIVIAVVAGGALLWIGLADYPSWSDVRSNILRQMMSSLGDILAGTVGVCLSFSATIFMVVTFNEQRRQHEEQLRQSTRERFENTFFNMLSMFFNVRETVNRQIAHDTDDQITSIQDYYDGFRRYYANCQGDGTVNHIERLLTADDLCEADLEQAEECLGEVFANYVSHSACSIGYYYRYVHNLVNFVMRQWCGDGNRDNRKQYLNMIQAQMSDEELGLVFYDAMSCHGLNKMSEKVFKRNLDEESFLENIGEMSLLSRNHHRLYRFTIFKFLDMEEKKAKRKR